MQSTDSNRDRRILLTIAAGGPVTQRSLARELGVALGLVNLLVRRLVSKGYIQISKAGPRHLAYILTPDGATALQRMTRQSLSNTVRLYTDTRNQLRASLAEISRETPPDAFGRKPVVFYGAGDVAEITFVSLQATDLHLAGVVDDNRTGLFFGHEIRSPECLRAGADRRLVYSRIVITSLRYERPIRARLAALDLPSRSIASL